MSKVGRVDGLGESSFDGFDVSDLESEGEGKEDSMRKGEGRREKGEGRRKKGEGRREKGEGRRVKKSELHT